VIKQLEGSLAFLGFFCVFSGSFGVLFYSLMHLFSVPANSQAIRH